MSPEIFIKNSFDKNQNSNSSECQEAGHLSQALKKANFFTCECGAFDNKVIQQDLPCSKRDRVSPGGRFQATSQDDSLFPISQVSESSAWARHSETLLTPDCAAAARAEATYNLTTTISRSCLLQPTIYRTGTVLTQCCRGFIGHITHGKGWVSNAFGRLTYFQTHGELHKGPCTFSLPVRELDLPVISLGTSALLLQLHI